jgi:conjugal transfer mating pair stabilization protein TraG
VASSTSQLGALAGGGRARFSFAHNDLLVSSSAGFSQSARSDTSTRFEAGKQAGPDTIEHFLGGGQQGQAMMENWLRGGFEMDRKGQWRLKPQVADTLERDVQAIMAQSGWSRSLSRSADTTATAGTTLIGSISGSATRSSPSLGTITSQKPGQRGGGQVGGSAEGRLNIESSDKGANGESARSSLDIVNYDVRAAIGAAEARSANSSQPAEAFAQELKEQVLGKDGLRNRYLQQADGGRGTFDLSSPITSMEKSSLCGPDGSPWIRVKGPEMATARLKIVEDRLFVPTAKMPKIHHPRTRIARIAVGASRSRQRSVWPCIGVKILCLDPIMVFDPGNHKARRQHDDDEERLKQDFEVVRWQSIVDSS